MFFSEFRSRYPRDLNNSSQTVNILPYMKSQPKKRVTFHCGESSRQAEAYKGEKNINEGNTKSLTLDIHAFGHDKTIITKNPYLHLFIE